MTGFSSLGLLRASERDWPRVLLFFFQAEDGIRDLVRSRGLGDVYKRQGYKSVIERLTSRRKEK